MWWNTLYICHYFGCQWDHLFRCLVGQIGEGHWVASPGRHHGLGVLAVEGGLGVVVSEVLEELMVDVWGNLIE